MLLDHLTDAAATPGWMTFFCDFIRADDVAASGSFTGTVITSGTIAAQATNGGWARLSGAATTDASGYQLQALAAHAMTTNKQVISKWRAQVNESTSTNVAVESQWQIGLFVQDTSIDASLPTDGIYFSKADGGTAILCIVRIAGAAAQSVTIPNVCDKLVHTYGIAVQPNGANSTVEFYIDGVSVCRMDTISLPASSVFLAESVAFRSGDATGTKWMDVDYVGGAQQR